MKVFDIATAKEIRSVEVTTGSVVTLQFDARGKNVVASGGPDRAIRAVNIETGAVTVVSEAIGAIQQFDFSADGRFMAVVTRTDIVMWDARTWKEVRRFAGRFGGRTFSAFSQDGAYISGVEQDGTVHVWETKTGREAANLGTVGLPNVGLRFGDDDRTLVVPAKDGFVKTFGEKTGR